jgi:hypothetical protein
MQREGAELVDTGSSHKMFGLEPNLGEIYFLNSAHVRLVNQVVVNGSFE